jgi:hypothetical protein
MMSAVDIINLIVVYFITKRKKKENYESFFKGTKVKMMAAEK